tara:strand:+ start:3564 stop:4004 length:441 start_codon:yes stop_codon:yes gene_type:complete
MVDSILTNQAPIAQQSNNNRSITNAAVSNASSIPEVEQSEQVVDITPRAMDSDANNAFASPVEPRTVSRLIDNSITSGIELRPPLENFSPIDITTERALENRVADIEIRTNDLVDETDSQANINNNAIEAFSTADNEIQQSVDISA